MKKAIAGILLSVSVACHGNPTGPTTVPESVNVSTSQPTSSNPAPKVEPVPNTAGWEGQVLSNAGWTVTNLTDIVQSYTAYWTDFDNQSLARGSQNGTVNPGDTFSGTFNRTCVQVDVSQFGPGGLPLFAGFIGKDGKLFNPNASPEKIAECRTQPTPPPCKPVYTTRGYFSIDSLSNEGKFYAIVDSSLVGTQGNLLGIWKKNLVLPKGDDLDIQFEHAPDGSTLTLWYLLEKIGSVKAKCGPTAAWHGNVSFQCVTTNSCEQPRD